LADKSSGAETWPCLSGEVRELAQALEHAERDLTAEREFTLEDTGQRHGAKARTTSGIADQAKTAITGPQV
jgi:hypothetical protein